MYVCLSVCLSVCMYIYIYIYTHTYVYTYRRPGRQAAGAAGDLDRRRSAEGALLSIVIIIIMIVVIIMKVRIMTIIISMIIMTMIIMMIIIIIVRINKFKVIIHNKVSIITLILLIMIFTIIGALDPGQAADVRRRRRAEPRPAHGRLGAFAWARGAVRRRTSAPRMAEPLRRWEAGNAAGVSTALIPPRKYPKTRRPKRGGFRLPMPVTRSPILIP